MKEGDDLSWYARKADGLRRRLQAPAAPEDPARAARVRALLDALAREGVRGSIELRTLHTGRLPRGCRGCLAGKGTNLYTTGLCTRDCFFCFNAKPRVDETVIHGLKIERPEQAAEIVARYGLRSVGISGGEPLLFPERVLGLIRALKALSFGVRVDLYTNGDRATDALLARLKEAGLDSIRFNLAANGYDTAPVRRALAQFPETSVELPVVPAELGRQERMLLELDALGVPFLNIHELFACRENDARVAGRGHELASAEPEALLWRPTAEGEEAALSLLLFALRNARRLSVYYCSCRTQELISERGLRRRGRIVAQ